ncbi:hypothetical protein K490DRAFT_67576 [Saccharata proteae CBS 121410]|uniref:Uncharacterized protein n=1 Tax=Saccharata proteae CBS 121410 TaxID=1314787 RepID=A0A9P4LX28_9PEZI|nr:hypothetical protein K490DRAFT_67576 [Saccharata proteae CBS 121410]
MSKQQQPQKQGNWLNRQVQSAVGGVGSVAGGLVHSVGNGVSGMGKGMGDGIAGTARGWGDGVRGYGNQVKDVTRAGGARAPTASNPLGIAGGSTQSAAIMKKGLRNAGGGSANNPLGLK